MIASTLQKEIEHYAVRMPECNPLYWKAERGLLNARCVVRYLANVRHIIGYTPVYLQRARNRANAIGATSLAEFFAVKIAEEEGHEEWADQDLAKVSTAVEGPNADLVPATAALVEFVAATIDKDPALYLSYILFVEQLVVLLGPQWLRLLEERCGIPASSMTVIGNHAELDRDHVVEGLEAIDRLVPNPSRLGPMLETLMATIAIFDRFCVEITADAKDEVRDVALELRSA